MNYPGQKSQYEGRNDSIKKYETLDNFISKRTIDDEKSARS